MSGDLINLPASEREPALRAWLTERLARYLGRTDIAADVAFAEYGIDSLVALNLYGDVEEELGLPVDVTVVLDYPTVAELAEHLSQQAEDAGPGDSQSPEPTPERSRP
jgi:[acyl-carrier-protein] S-malonyltransferase